MTDAIRDGNHVPVALGVSAADATITLPFKIDSNTGKLLVEDTAGGVVGPASSTDNALVRWDGTGGEQIQNSTATLSDAGVIDAAGYKAGGTSAVADGTYTVGSKITPVTGHDGTITVKGGIIIAIQQAD